MKLTANYRDNGFLMKNRSSLVFIFFLDFKNIRIFREMKRFQKLKNTKMEMSVPNLNGAISVRAFYSDANCTFKLFSTISNLREQMQK